VLVAIATSSCGTTRASKSPPLSAQARWIVFPVANRATAPQAGERLEAILLALLRMRGLLDVDTYVSPKDAEAQILESDDQRIVAAHEYAKTHGYKYAVLGTVLEWGYKSGIDGEPAVGISVRVIDVPSGKTVWAAAGSRTGWGRESVSGNALGVTENLLDALQIER
jgi:TolB-like protein